jgi:mono/diheme cytochrome c family protein
MKQIHIGLPALSVLLVLWFTGALADTAVTAAGQDTVARGRYLAQVSGCNDCHTPGYAMNNGDVPEAIWLTGDNFGWRGPWGTTYGSNLRLFVKDMSESEWVDTARTLVRRPPMPWFNLNRMEEADLRALYRYIRSLGEPGAAAHAWVPPGEEPDTPYALFPSPPPVAQ